MSSLGLGYRGSDSTAWWEDTLDLLLPDGRGLVAVLRAYLDESRSNAGIFCVAGYLFEPVGARGYAQEMQRTFGPYGGFHMTDLVARRQGFDGISDAKRDELVRAAVEITNRHILAGAAVSCDVNEFQESSLKHVRGFGSAYALCCRFVAHALGSWAKERWPGGTGGIAYIFESGEDHQAEANELLAQANKIPELRDSLQYRSHTFMGKNDAPPLWGGDLLAWEWSKYWSETVTVQKRLMRKDLRELLMNGWDWTAARHPKYVLRHLGGQPLENYFSYVAAIDCARTQEELDAAVEAHFSVQSGEAELRANRIKEER